MSAIRTDDEPPPPRAPLNAYDDLVWRWVTYTYEDGTGGQSTGGYAAIHPDEVQGLLSITIGEGIKALAREGKRAILLARRPA